MQSEAQKQYEELRKRFNLPDFAEIDKEFEVSDLDKTHFLLRTIIRRIADKLDFYSTMLEEILQPDTSNLYAMHETRFFDQKEKNKMYDLYSRIMAFNRKSIEISLNNSEKEEADFIKSVAQEWKIIKNELIPYVKKMKDSWKIEVDIKEDLRYFG